MRFRRRKFINNAGMQLRFSFMFIIMSLAGSIAATVAFNMLALKRLDQLTWKTHISVKDTGEIIGPLFMYVNAVDFVFVAVLLSLTVMWLNKKTTGPIYRMAKDIRRVAEGDLTTDISLRQKDEFRDTALELNIMTKRIKEKFRDLTEEYNGISKSLTELEHKNRDGSVSAEEYGAILDDVKKIETELMKFGVS